ncbi:MAG: hypothetical protein RL189_1503 [Pseudomonadota bacterium]
MSKNHLGLSVVAAVACALPFPLAMAQESSPSAQASDKKEAPAAGSAQIQDKKDDSPGDAAAPADIDDRFSTEGYAGIFVAALQNTVPSLGLSGSVYLDDDFRTGLDIWAGNSKGAFSSFKTQGAGLWTAWEVSERLWLKGGFSYSRLDRPSEQEPLAALTGSKDMSKKQTVRTDTIQADLSLGQLWSFTGYSISVDYFGFSTPFLTLTGPKHTMFNIHALRVDFLYDID